MRKEKIQNEIDKTLGLLDQKESLPPNPYFYTRIMQRLDEKKRKEFSFSNILKPALFTLLLVLNLTTIVWYTSPEELTDQTESEIALVDVLKSDLNLDNDLSENLIFE
ncbi:MAG: hypothetical protein R3250_00725 [Melioribacteraceae bacterium]|nr:hypothetical protein [Melioribacteraceae bacterium]